MRIKELKTKEIKILRVMQDQQLCVPQLTKIAHHVQEPTSTVRDRLIGLEKRGVIIGYVPLIDATAAGQAILVFVMANLQDLEHPEKACSAISKFDWVQGVYFLVGDKDVLIKVRAKDIDDYHAKMKRIRKYIIGGGGIVCSKVFKDSTHVPLV